MWWNHIQVGWRLYENSICQVVKCTEGLKSCGQGPGSKALSRFRFVRVLVVRKLITTSTGSTEICEQQNITDACYLAS